MRKVRTKFAFIVELPCANVSIYSYCPYTLSVRLKGTGWTGRMDRGTAGGMMDRVDSVEASDVFIIYILSVRLKGRLHPSFTID